MHRSIRILGLAVGLGGTFGALGSGAPALAWTPATQAAIAERAAEIAPSDLFRQIDRHRQRLREGALAAFDDGDAARHVKNPDGRGRLDEVIAIEVEGAIRAIRGHHPFAEIVRRLGVVSHYVADANDPLATSDADPGEAGYSAPYLRYVEGAHDRFAVIFYGLDPDLEERGDLAALLARTLARGRQLYPLVRLEYERLARPGEALDDRSTAFGVGSVACRHAVSDVSLVLRHIWLAGGGIDPRPLPIRGDRLLLLPPVGAAR